MTLRLVHLSGKTYNVPFFLKPISSLTVFQNFCFQIAFHHLICLEMFFFCDYYKIELSYSYLHFRCILCIALWRRLQPHQRQDAHPCLHWCRWKGTNRSQSICKIHTQSEPFAKCGYPEDRKLKRTFVTPMGWHSGIYLTSASTATILTTNATMEQQQQWLYVTSVPSGWSNAAEKTKRNWSWRARFEWSVCWVQLTL